MPNKRKCIFGRFEIELVFYPVDKKLICCTVQNPYKSEKHEVTFLDKTEDRVIRKIDRKIKEWRKEFKEEEK